MIFIKTFSIQRWKQGWCIRIFFLVIFILLILIPLLSSEDEVVFSEGLNGVVLVVLPSETSDILLEGTNFKKQGRVQKNTPFIYEIQSDERVQLMITPDHGLPLKKSLVFEMGKLVISEGEKDWVHMVINEWPHQVYEIQIFPPRSIKMGMKEKETLVNSEKVDLDGDKKPEHLDLINQDGYYFIEVDGTRLLLKERHFDHLQWEIRDINHNGDKEIIISGNIGEQHRYVEIYGFQDNQIQRSFWEHGEEITFHDNGRIQVEKRLLDSVDHFETITYGWDGGEYIQESTIISYWQGKPKWPQTRQSTIRAFFEALELGLEKEVKGYIIEEHRQEAQARRIIGSIKEGWRNITQSAYYFHGGYGQENVFNMAFYYDTDIHGKYKQVKIYEIETRYEESMQGPWKIAGIKEVE